MAAATDLRRLRWSVPNVDVATNKWLDAQYDISQSLRELIHEAIRREGYIDVINKPVEQLPRRGRPPLEAADYETNASENSDADGDRLEDEALAQIETQAQTAAIPLEQSSRPAFEELAPSATIAPDFQPDLADDTADLDEGGQISIDAVMRATRV